MKLITDTLMLELTRRCNMKCLHCLRGNCQNIDMQFEMAKTAIDAFDTIHCLTLTGGEPTLCTDMIENIVNYIITEQKDVRGFYIASNGKEVNMNVMISLAKLYAYIVYQNGGYLDDYSCTFDISSDQFHDNINPINEAILGAFTFVHQRGEIPIAGIINEGNANYNGLGHRNIAYDTRFSLVEEEDEIECEMFYVNAKGNILPNCDFSFNTQDDLSEINISDNTDILHLMKCYNEMMERY